MNTLDDIVTNLAKNLKPAVEQIEADKCPATRHNYGAYMAIISQFSDDIGQARVLAMALKLAGANAQGVDDALRVSY